MVLTPFFIGFAICYYFATRPLKNCIFQPEQGLVFLFIHYIKKIIYLCGV